jgi:CheY-like chemotaxis protein
MPTILLVDDNDQYRTMLNAVLTFAGYEVSEARNGKEALRIYHEWPADLVITDLVMPEKEGLELIRELRGQYPEARIIAISGGGRLNPVDYLELATEFGARKVLPKPFTNHQLIEAVKACLTGGTDLKTA